MSTLHLPCALLFSAAVADAQSFTNDASSIPQGAPFNNNETEQVDFGDVDGDGDIDVVLANGGDAGDQQNRIWINQGGAQGGAVGVFGDETATRFPSVLDTSRDLEFVDLDNDGDLDLHTANTSDWTPQACRFWINMGGVQGGTAGVYADQTATRWSGLGAAGSSLANSQLLPGGGFRDWTSDADFGDLDNDGDADLFHTSVGASMTGNVPTRVFLNAGGVFSEFNPSGFQLAGSSIQGGQPGLWCQGTQQHATGNSTGLQCDIADIVVDSDLGDLDGDFDLDAVWCGHGIGPPRFFRNRLAESGGALGFRDVTSASYVGPGPTSQANYEQELGDLDDDGDLDLYGVNWSPNFADRTMLNDGTGLFALGTVLPASTGDDEEADFLDYDGDGDLDVFVAGFGGQDRLYRNGLIGGGGAWSDVTSSLPVLPTTGYSRDADACDVDADGDTDVFVAFGGSANVFLRNATQTLDTRAPRIPSLEQAAARYAAPPPTVVRARVFDNAPDYVTAFDAVWLEYRVNGGAFATSPMTWMGGQLFRGEIPGLLIGAIDYRVNATDARGNTGVSAMRSYVAGVASSYCTAGTTTHGCTASIASTGIPSATNASGFNLLATGVEGATFGTFFYGLSGRLQDPWGPGAGFLCVKQPVQRTPIQPSGGTAGQCDGSFVLDWNAYRATHPAALGQPHTAGQVIDAQAWFRDAAGSKTTSLSSALEFAVQP